MFDQILSILSNHPYLTILVGLVTIYNFINRGRKCDLPGPYGLPLIGYAPFVGKAPYKAFTKLGKTYGPIYQVKVGMNNIVVLGSLDIGIEALGGNISFGGRPTSLSFRTIVSTGKSRFAFKPANETWRFLRKVASRSLGLFASSRNSKLDAVIHEADDYMEQTINAKAGQAQNPKDIIATTVATVIGSVLFGMDFDNQNPLVKSLLTSVEVVSNFVQVNSIIDNLPFAEYLLAGKIRTFKQALEPINQIAGEQLEKHQYYGTEDDVRDVADALVKVSEEATPAEMKLVDGDKLKIRHIATDLFAAGFGTTAESFRWFLNIIAVNQDVQKRCQKELDDYLSLTGRQEVSLTDKGRMAYVDATMTEMFRFATLVPLGLPHSMMDDTIFKGYFIPKGTMVFLNIYAIHHDEEMFPNSGAFQPVRFLRDDGSFNAEKAAKVVPFSVGKRRCVGEALARQELFMLFANTLLKFNVKVGPGQIVDFNIPRGGFTRMPHDIELIFDMRD